jgi:hypothetical protein
MRLAPHTQQASMHASKLLVAHHTCTLHGLCVFAWLQIIAAGRRKYFYSYDVVAGKIERVQPPAGESLPACVMLIVEYLSL